MRQISHSKLPQQVSDDVLNSIADGKFIPGATLPNENDMAAEYGVSRTVVREATHLLRSKGVLDVRQGRGTFVTPKDQWAQMDPQILLALLNAGRLGEMAQDLLEVRTMLEVEAAGLAALRASSEDVQMLEALLEGMALASKQDTQQYIALEHQFHTQIWKIANNRLLLFMLESLSEVFVSVKSVVYRDNWLDVDRDHRAVVGAIKMKDAALARGAMAEDIVRFEDEIRSALEDGVR